jgi:leucyl aminopeptidase
MEIKVLTGEIFDIQSDALIIPFFEGEDKIQPLNAALDKALDGIVSRLIAEGEIKGKFNEVTLIHTFGKLPASRLVILGLGRRSEFSKDRIRSGSANVLKLLRGKKVSDVTVKLMGVGVAGITVADSAEAITQGAMLGLYVFDKHKTANPDKTEIKKLTIVEADPALLSVIEESCRVAAVKAEASILARDMVNEPANYMTPTAMAETAKNLAGSYNLKINVLDTQQMRELGMGALLGVSQGSEQPPRFIVLRYRGKDDEKIDIALVGKGITFDSGGISLKPAEGMQDMKGDMAGGAAVMAVIAAVSRLKLNVNILAVVPATENMPGGRSFKPGDVLTAMNAKTIEVISTDAEGRLILADALAYTKTFDVAYIIDVATLTGACQVALGNLVTGVFGNNQELVDRVLNAGKTAGEKMWQLPMPEEYKDLYKSDVADIKNHGGRFGGAIIAAQFLGEFVGGTPWVHLDIAGTSDTDKDKGYFVKGATGVPVRTLIDLIIDLAK